MAEDRIHNLGISFLHAKHDFYDEACSMNLADYLIEIVSLKHDDHCSAHNEVVRALSDTKKYYTTLRMDLSPEDFNVKVQSERSQYVDQMLKAEESIKKFTAHLNNANTSAYWVYLTSREHSKLLRELANESIELKLEDSNEYDLAQHVRSEELNLKESVSNTLNHSTTTIISSKMVGMEQNQIVLIHYFYNYDITDKNANDLAKGYGFDSKTSGDQLVKKYRRIRKLKGRIDETLSKRKMNCRIRLFESILPILPTTAQTVADSELNRLNEIYEKLYE